MVRLIMYINKRSSTAKWQCTL